MKTLFRLLCFACSLFPALPAWPEEFDFTKHSIPPEKIKGGGPPKDGIPSLTDPKFVPASAASFLKDSDRVIGVFIGSAAKAYPYRILTWHEAVNDLISDRPIAVTY